MKLQITLWIMASWYVETSLTKDCYIAAVLDHDPRENNDDQVAGVKENLEVYQKAVREATEWRADIVVFPESGLIPWDVTMWPEQTENLAEEIPDPKTNIRWNPCNENSEPVTFGVTQNPILTTLSCMAMEGSLYVVASTYEKTPGPEPNQTLFYCTTVVFDNKGMLVARHRYTENIPYSSLSKPAEFEVTTFNTEFGKFAVLTGYEPGFKEAVELVEKHEVDSVVLSTSWNEEMPFWISLPFLQAWSLVHKVNLLVSNVHSPVFGFTGSMISSSTQGALNYIYDLEHEKSELIVSEISRNENCGPIIQDGSVTVPEGHYYSSIFTEYTASTALTDKEGTVETCDGQFCCKLSYKANAIPQEYYLFAFSGLTDFIANTTGAICQEICLLAVCEPQYNCTLYAGHSQVVFGSASMTSTMATKYQYPFVVADKGRLVRKSAWDFTPGKLELVPGTVQQPLLSMGIHGRCYDQDIMAEE